MVAAWDAPKYFSFLCVSYTTAGILILMTGYYLDLHPFFKRIHVISLGTRVTREIHRVQVESST